MKNLLLIILFSTSFGYSQDSSESSGNYFLYGNAGVSTGNYNAIEGGINYIPNGNFSYHLNYYFRSRKDENKPHDYSGGFLGSSSVYNQYHSFVLSAGYMIPLNQSKTIRLLLKGGPGLRLSKVAENYKAYSSGSGWFSSTRYSYDRNNKYSVELTVNPALEFAIARGYGLSVSPIISFGSGRTFYGVSLNNIFGKVRDRL